MREASQAEIEVPDVEVDVFRKLLEHLYTDTNDIPKDIALRLFSAADRFGVDRLRQLCVARVESVMDGECSPSASHLPSSYFLLHFVLIVETVSKILTVADQHNASHLKDDCVQFIVNHFAEVHNTEGFKALDRELLDAVHAAISARLFPAKSFLA